MTAWTIGGVPLPSTVVFTALSTTPRTHGSSVRRDEASVTTEAYEGRGESWVSSGAVSIDRQLALAAMRASGEWVPVTTDDGSVVSFIGLIHSLHGQVLDSSSEAPIMVRVGRVAASSTEAFVEATSLFEVHDF